MAKAVVVADEQNTGIDRMKSQPARLKEFLDDVRSEMRKVIWPSREEVKSTTIVVLVTVFVFAAFFWVIDSIAGRAIEALLHKLASH